MEFDIDFWHWLIVAVLFGIIEVLSPGFFFIWLGVAAAIMGMVLLAIPSLSWEVQVLVFTVLAVASALAGRRLINRHPIESDHPLLNQRGAQFVGRTFTLAEGIDNGTGKIRGIWMQSNPNVAPIFSAWIAPLKDLGVEILGPRSVTSTDHTNIDRTGVPGFQFVQERLEYNSRTHHTNMDFYDRVQVDDVKQAATVAAVFAYQTAMRDEKLPRK